MTHIYIHSIKQPTLHYLTRSVRRRAATSKRGNRRSRSGTDFRLFVTAGQCYEDFSVCRIGTLLVGRDIFCQDLILGENASSFERSALRNVHFHSMSGITKRGYPCARKNGMNVQADAIHQTFS